MMIGCPQGSTLSIVAHQDDDVLFLNPDIYHDIRAGKCARTVYLTSGDAGLGQSYWQGRENGSKAAYVTMGGLSWVQTDAGINGHPMPVFTLVAQPNITLIFMRLPDGNIYGGGFPSTGNVCLEALWRGNINNMTTVDHTSSYNKQDVLDTLLAHMTAFQPDTIRIQDYTGTTGDHSDHYYGALFAQLASQQYTTPHTLVGYYDYVIATYPANLSPADITAKQNAYVAYAKFDPNVCQTVADCGNGDYGKWLQRAYPLATPPPPQPVPPSAPPPSSTQMMDVSTRFVLPPAPLPPVNSDLALSATATASSQNISTQQTANKAINGVIGGYPGDYTQEWATVGGKAGSWLTLTWTSPQTVGRIVLYDRPNSDDRIMAGNVQFSDGSIVTIGALPNAGTASTLTFTPKTVTSLTLNITAVSSATQNIGLSEIQVYAS